MGEWVTTTLGEVVAKGKGKIQTGPFGSQLHAADYVDVGIPCIMPTNMKDNRVDLTDIAFITEEDAKRLSQHLVQEGDIVYSRRGDVTQKALIRKSEAGYFCGTGCLLVRPGTAIDSEFLTYHLSTPSNQAWIMNQAVGAHMANLNTGILVKVPLRVPDRAEQRKVAEVLSTLDAKIDLNNRINAELEALAKTIYDYWFVQFDFPDTHGRPYKSSGGAMVWSDALKREIPLGWEARPLSELVSVSTNSINPADAEDKSYRHMSIPGFDASGSFVSELGSSIGSNKFTVERNDLLISKLNPWFNRVVADTSHEDMICSTEFVVWRCGNATDQAYLNAIATHPRFIAHCTRSASGTSNSHKRVNPQVMMRYLTPYSAGAAKQFGKLVAPFLAQRIRNGAENRELTQLRDWLLPLLMNGQVYVGDPAGGCQTAQVPDAASAVA